jgi:A/G-specific adenine glycosylase
MKDFSDKIIAWYNIYKRDLPWRNTNNPYLIWLSEIILQQTRVDQGMSYYLKFAETFPTIKHLAKAENDAIMKLWQGLGYYSRARNMHTTAIHIAEHYNSKFPDKYEDVLSLKGIGEYTAAAIVSFAYNKPHAVVDGNVFRVLSRVFGIETPIDTSKGKKEFYELANKLIDKKHPGLYNQAIIEFGALQCKPVNPDCSVCPLNNMCYAFAESKITQLPVKSNKTKVRKRYFNYLVLSNKHTIALNKRIAKDIWINLFDFPLIETDKQLSEEEFLSSDAWRKFIGKNKYSVKAISGIHKHILSHQHIFARFWEIESKTDLKKLAPSSIIIKQKDFKKYAVPRLIDIYWEKRK